MQEILNDIEQMPWVFCFDPTEPREIPLRPKENGFFVGVDRSKVKVISNWESFLPEEVNRPAVQPNVVLDSLFEDLEIFFDFRLGDRIVDLDQRNHAIKYSK